MCRIFISGGWLFLFASAAGNLSANGSRKLSLSETKEERTALHLPPSGQASSPHTSNLSKFFIFLRLLSKFLDRKCWRPDAKSNILTKMQLIAFYRPQNPRKIAVSQAGTSLAIIIMGRRSTDRRIYVSLFSEERTTYGVFTYPIGHRSPSAGHPPGGHHTPGRAVSVHCRVRRRRDAVRP